MRSAALDDAIRFHRLDGASGEWLFDGWTLELLPAPLDVEEELGERLELAEEPAPFPYHTRTRISNLKLALSNRCPSDCAYCFRDRREQPAPRPGLIGELLEAMVGGFGREARSYTVTFNLASEPLAELDQLAELSAARAAVEAATGKPVEIFFCTSATIQTPRALEALASVPSADRLVVSIDGPREVHDRFRRDAAGRGTFDRVLRLIEWGQGRGMHLESQSVLTAAYPFPDRIVEELLGLGFEQITMKPVRAGFASAFGEGDLAPLLASYDRYFARLGAELAAGRTSRLAALKNDFALRPLWKLALGVRAEGRCFWGSSHIVADAAGDYYPCDSVLGRPEFRCGSLDEGVDWTRFHADVSWRTRPGCARCWSRPLCGGTCYASGLALRGDHLAVDPAECAMSRYFAEKCLGLVIGMMEAGEDPLAVRRILVGEEPDGPLAG